VIPTLRNAPLQKCQPFVKWAGGKRQLLGELEKRLPAGWNTYFEPFVGGGALFTRLGNRGLLPQAVIADLNGELVNLYRIIQQDPGALIMALSDERMQNTAGSYKACKERFNAIMGEPACAIERAALLTYLNKHGFNGLWRVNRKGFFNVPFGSYKKLSIPDETSILRFSALLKTVKILNTDFEAATRGAKRGDFVYFDPPYLPLSKTANFTDYNALGFPFSEQERLAAHFRKLTRKGVYAMLSNSRVPEIEMLYEEFFIETVTAKRFINCNGERRNGIQEVIVTNYRYD
jgi:DNA adenine methylase